MAYVTSADGTSIAYQRDGNGPPVILIGGGLDDGSENAPLGEELAQDFTAYNFARRGRDDSGDTQPYAVEREIEDLAVLITEAGGSAHLFGASQVACSPWKLQRPGCRSAKWRSTRCRTTLPTTQSTGRGNTVSSSRWRLPRVKTYGPRGTVHLLAADDLPMWMAALSAIPSHSPFPDGVRLTPEQAEDIVDAIGRALEDAELTIDELDQAVIDLVGAWAGDRVMPAFQDLWPRWRQAVVPAAYRGVLCFGPSRGRRVTYTNPRSWTPGFRLASPDKAIATMITRYLYAYGPATPQQFAQWIGAPPTWAGEQFTRHSPKLTKINFDGTPAWMPRGDTDMPAEQDTKSSVLLLPYFDAYAVGSHPRSRLFPGEAATRALAPSGQAGNYPVLLIEGVVAGVWHQRRSGRQITVTVEPLIRLTAGQRRALENQVERIGEILEGNPRLSVGTVTAGGHA